VKESLYVCSTLAGFAFSSIERLAVESRIRSQLRFKKTKKAKILVHVALKIRFAIMDFITSHVVGRGNIFHRQEI
jgi:hypothetical protein